MFVSVLGASAKDPFGRGGGTTTPRTGSSTATPATTPASTPLNISAETTVDQALAEAEADAASRPAGDAAAAETMSRTAEPPPKAGGWVDGFLGSWALFRNTYLAGWLIALALSLVGVLVVARDQIFVGAALSQASSLGVAVAMWARPLLGLAAGDAPGDGLLPSVLAVAFAVLASLLTARGGRGLGDSPEAVTGWVFLASASLSVLVVSRSPHGLEVVQRLASSSLIGATPADVGVFAALAGLSIVAVAVLGRPILLLATDAEMAAAVGMRVGLWSAALAVWLGVSVGLSIRVSGSLYTFGFLVLPALVAKNLCSRTRPMFVVAPAVAVAAAVAAFVVANHHDYPPGQMAVALLSVVLALVWGARTGLRLVGGGRT